MKIAYITINNPKNYRSWSGLNYNIYKCLKSAGHEVFCIGPLSRNLKIFYVLKRIIFGFVGIKFDADRTVKLSKYYSKQVENKISDRKYDLIVTSDTSTVSYLKTNIPIVMWLDTTFQSWYKHYFSNHNVSQQTLIEGNLCEQKALDNSSIVFVTSNWAKNEIFKFYECTKRKVNILPFGNNLELNPSLKKILNKKKNEQKCKIISIGVDWDRKGFSRTISICDKIKKKGLNVELIIIGPEKKYELLPSWIKIYSFLDKNKKKNRSAISNLLIKSDFHLLMTKSEAFGIVFVEASSHGVFNIALDIGGVGGAIKNNVNGKLFKKHIKDEQIASYVYKCFMNKKNMRKKIVNSKLYYEKELDWKKIGKKFNVQLKKYKFI